MERFICIHGHFYQPPRENPWLEAIELQDSAHPYHDWNERITAECYAPNAASRILDGEDRIQSIVNNYSRISFNFGPTLLSWLESKAEGVYRAVLAADRESARLFSGHGSALAQPYNHMILPLASARDKLTQVRWGVRDFEWRFGRVPEGMWLPETAVDLPTLEALARAGIRFTILAPSQARRTRKIGGRAWRDEHGSVDPSRAYELRLPSGRRIQVLFYDGPISSAVAFERLLRRGDDLAHRLVGAFSDSRPWNQLVHIATDGETYGHHHRHGDMALAYALEYIESRGLARLTNYGEYLERHPPDHQVEIHENSSWSCASRHREMAVRLRLQHRFHPGWNQAWRGPLREALRLAEGRDRAAFRGGGRASCSPIRGRRGTTTSRSSSTGRPNPGRASWRATPRIRSTPRRRSRHGSCLSCNDTPCSCTRAAAGSSTSFPGSRPCRSSNTRAAPSSWPRRPSGAPWRSRSSRGWTARAVTWRSWRAAAASTTSS
jgi:alpha-amylase/alpha-mannosidase (GH57 family)